MSYVYSDAEMLVSTQIAYLDIPEGYTVGQYVAIMEELAESGNDRSNEFQDKYDVVLNLKKLAEENHISDWKNWKVVDVCDKNNASGMYGCLIDTGDGNAILGFRGSESYDSAQSYRDWVVADVGMLDSYTTEQQYDASRYTREIWEKYGKKYSTFSFTGHSLGGNLAEHSGITAPEAMRSHIDHTISFDGPGFSNEYLKFHKEDIEKSKEYSTHYAWSWVGCLLTQPSGVENRIIDANDSEQKGKTCGVPNSELWRHHTGCVNLYNGSVRDGEQTSFMKTAHTVTTAVDSDWTMRILGYIPVIGSALRWADTIHKSKSKIRAKSEVSERRLYEIFEMSQSFAQDTYQRYFAPDVSGDFEINILSARACSHELIKIHDYILSTSQEIISLQSSLKYDSVSGSYYKTKVWCICNQMIFDAIKIKKMADTLEEICKKYAKSDEFVSELYI